MSPAIRTAHSSLDRQLHHHNRPFYKPTLHIDWEYLNDLTSTKIYFRVGADLFGQAAQINYMHAERWFTYIKQKRKKIGHVFIIILNGGCPTAPG